MKHMRQVALAFALALGTVATPQHFGVPLPGVGEPAHAYAPCVMELQAVQGAQYWVDYWFDEMLVPPFNHIVWFN